MLKDAYGRKINYLRISLTDRCNLRCNYCMPPNGVDPIEHERILRYEELILIIEAAAQLGISSIRLTGGEPLIRKGVIPFIKLISSIEGIDDIALTTNGVLLGEMGQDLKKAGISRVNISLDTLDREKYKKITGKDSLHKVINSIDASFGLGFNPIKINVVLLKDYNFDEVLDFVNMSKDRPLHIRFIEMMPLGESPGNFNRSFVSWSNALAIVKTHYNVRENSGPNGKGPAKYYNIDGFQGTFGFITAVSEHFCQQCNRVRITSDGKLKTCLFGENEVNLKKLSQLGDIEKIKEALILAIMKKPQSHNIKSNTTTSRFMSQIGG